jgi:hypothetical protein
MDPKLLENDLAQLMQTLRKHHQRDFIKEHIVSPVGALSLAIRLLEKKQQRPVVTLLGGMAKFSNFLPTEEVIARLKNTLEYVNVDDGCPIQVLDVISVSIDRVHLSYSRHALPVTVLVNGDVYLADDEAAYAELPNNIHVYLTIRYRSIEIPVTE